MGGREAREQLVADPSNTSALSRIDSALLEVCLHDSDQIKSSAQLGGGGGGGQ